MPHTMTLALPAGLLFSRRVTVVFRHEKDRAYVQRLLRMRVEVDVLPSVDPSAPQLSLLLLLELLPPRSIPAVLVVAPFLRTSDTALDALECVIANAAASGFTGIELEVAQGTVLDRRFAAGVTETVLRHWKLSTAPLASERLSEWKIQVSESVQDFFYDVCAVCHMSTCAHDAERITLRQRTNDAGTEIIHKTIVERVDLQVVSWVVARNVVRELSATRIAFPDWVNIHDVAFRLGPLAIRIVNSTIIDVSSLAPTMALLANIKVPRPNTPMYPSVSVPDCRMRFSTETVVQVPQLLMPVTWIRKSQRETLVRGAWSLVIYTSYDGASEKTVNENRQSKTGATHHVELELDFHKYAQENASKPREIIARMAAASFLQKLYNIFGKQMCAAGCSFIPTI